MTRPDPPLCSPRPIRAAVPLARVVLLVALLVGVLGAPAAADEREAARPVPSPRIVGGTTADNGEYPFTVALLRRSVTTSSYDAQFCGGTLIAPTVVLTAAHCLVGSAATGGVDVLVGGHDLTTGQGTRIEAVSTAIHPRFDRLDIDFDHDFAILRLAEAAPAEPVRLVGIGEDAAWQPGTAATAAGWGRTGAGVAATTLQEVSLPIVGDDVCADIYQSDLYPDTMVCAGPLEGGRDACSGDSGGPLVVPGPTSSGAWLQVGIVSWGVGCAEPDLPGVYAEVGAGRAWIDQFLPPAARFTPLGPERLLDTRSSGIPLEAGRVTTLAVSGQRGVPATDVTSVALNVTALGATLPTHVTVWPGGTAKPGASTLNLLPGATVANSVVARLGPDGSVALTTNSGSTQVVVDVVGWFSDGLSPDGSLLTAVPPTRLFDTRRGSGGVPDAPLGQASTLEVQVAGQAGVPSTGATAVVVNLTATEATAPTNLTVWGASAPRPTTSTLNLVPGATVPNLAVVELDAAGRIAVFNRAGEVEVLADVVGWFGEPDGSTGDTALTGLLPARLLDTRTTVGGAPGAVGPAGTVTLPVAGVGGVPPDAVAVVLNVTLVGPTGATHLTVHPAGIATPLASNLNAVAGQTVANLVVVPLGAGGAVTFRNQSGATYVVADVVGFFGSPAT